MNEETKCPHCGAEQDTLQPNLYYLCGSIKGMPVVSDLLARYPEMPYMTHASILEIDSNETAKDYQVRYFVGSAD